MNWELRISTVYTSYLGSNLGHCYQIFWTTGSHYQITGLGQVLLHNSLQDKLRSFCENISSKKMPFAICFRILGS